MRTALRRAFGLATAGTLAAGGVLATAAPAPAQSPNPCASSCIAVDDISGTPEGAVFTFHTTALTRVQVQITNLDGSKPVVLTPPTTWGSNYQLTADDPARFGQASIYKYAIVASDTSGYTREYRGEFVTLYRKASVSFDSLHVIKDGDDLGPGDFVGVSRCGEGADWLPLPPLPHDSVMANIEGSFLELNDGQTAGIVAEDDCGGPVGPTVEAETNVEDDDFPGVLASQNYWEPGDPYVKTFWNDENWDESYTTQTVSDPLDPTAIGSADVPTLTTSPFLDPIGVVTNMRYQMTGHVTFTHAAPMVNLPAPQQSSLMFNAQPTVGSDGTSIALNWTPGLYPEVGAATAIRVQWKPQGAVSWQHADVPSTAASYRPSGLTPGTTYDFAVSLVRPDNTLAMYTPVSAYLPGWTDVGGWSTSTVTAPTGTKVPANLTVDDGGVARSVVLEFEPAGTTTWQTAYAVQTDGAGHASVTMTVGPGYVKWRVRVPATALYRAATTPARLLVAKTAISGFNATAVTASSGTKLPDTISVTPGANRRVNLMYRKSGTTTWALRAALTTDANGAVVLPEVAINGTYQWQAIVPANSKQGNGAWTAVRSVTGT